MEGEGKKREKGKVQKGEFERFRNS